MEDTDLAWLIIIAFALIGAHQLAHFIAQHITIIIK